MTPAASPENTTSVWSHRDFTLFWIARAFANVAVQAESVTLGWQVYTVARLTRSVEESAFMVGMVGLAQFVPLFLLTFIAGATADQRDRRTIVLVCTVFEIFCVGALALVARNQAPNLLPIFGIASLFGASRAFLSPAAGALGPMLVPRDLLPRAISWSSLGDQGTSMLGPWVGGALCAISPAIAYGGAGILYALAALAILLMATRSEPAPETSEASRLGLVREGIAYVWTNKVVLGSLSLDLFAVLLGGASALLPVFARDVLHVGSYGFGILRGGPAIGAALMAFALSRRPLHRRAGAWMFAGVAVFGVATIVFAISKSLVLSVVALIVLGAADMISVYVRQSLIQIVTPDRMRGRVSAVANLFIGASAELGEFETGVVARMLGPIGAAIFGGVGSLVITLAWSRMFPALRKADRLDDAAPPNESP